MITLNCFTNGFHGQPSTQAGKTPRLCRWVYGRREFDGVTIFEDGDIWSGAVDGVRSRYKVGWLHEPRALHPANYDKAIEWRHKFDRILTHDQVLLDRYPDKFRYCVHGGVSIPRDQWGRGPKTKLAGMFDTRKAATDGHRLRHHIATSVPGIDVFYNLYGAPKVETMRQYRFWVVVENSAEPNWFTEHVLDPVALGCVPVCYWPPEAWAARYALNDYLDVSGLLPWTTQDELASIVTHINEFGPEFYQEFAGGMESNLGRLPELELVEDWMVEHALTEYL